MLIRYLLFKVVFVFFILPALRKAAIKNMEARVSQRKPII